MNAAMYKDILGLDGWDKAEARYKAEIIDLQEQHELGYKGGEWCKDNLSAKLESR